MTEPDGPMFDGEGSGRVNHDALVADLNDQEDRLQNLWDEADLAAAGSIKRMLSTQVVQSGAQVLRSAERHVEGYEVSLDLSRPEDGEDE